VTDPTILVADDHPLFRDALKLALRRVAPTAPVLEAGDVAGALSCIRAEPGIHLILLDLMMADSNGFSGLASIRAALPQAIIIVVTAADASQAAARAREFGANGFLSKSADLSAIEAVVRRALDGEAELDGFDVSGDPAPDLDAMAARIASLTPAQLKVLLALLNGRLNKQIAYDMSISEATVKAHMTAVFRKLNVRNRTQAVLAARALGLDMEQPEI
jgi:DNA-binding NarL/FixJ family response regulator